MRHGWVHMFITCLLSPWPSNFMTSICSGLVVQVVSALSRGNWQDFNWHNALCGLSAIAVLFVSLSWDRTVVHFSFSTFFFSSRFCKFSHFPFVIRYPPAFTPSPGCFSAVRSMEICSPASNSFACKKSVKYNTIMNNYLWTNCEHITVACADKPFTANLVFITTRQAHLDAL